MTQTEPNMWRDIYGQLAAEYAQLLKHYDLAEDATADDIIAAAAPEQARDTGGLPHVSYAKRNLLTGESRLLCYADDKPWPCPAALSQGAAHEERGPCWFCKQTFVVDALIAGYDTFDEQRLACLACNERMQAAHEERGLDVDDIGVLADARAIALADGPTPEAAPDPYTAEFRESEKGEFVLDIATPEAAPEPNSIAETPEDNR